MRLQFYSLKSKMHALAVLVENIYIYMYIIIYIFLVLLISPRVPIPNMQR